MNDLDAVAALFSQPDHGIAAVFAEPFLGAGGVRPAAPGFLAAVADLARDRDVLFVLDEVRVFAMDLAASRAGSG